MLCYPAWAFWTCFLWFWGCTAFLEVLACLLDLHIASLSLSNSCFSPLFPNLIPPTHTRPTLHAPAPPHTLFLGHTSSFVKGLSQLRQGLSASPTCPFSASSRHWSPPLSCRQQAELDWVFWKGSCSWLGEEGDMERSRGRGNCGQPWNERERFPSLFLPNFANSGAGKISHGFLSLPHFSLSHTQYLALQFTTFSHTHPDTCMVHTLSSKSAQLPPSLMSPILTTIEMGSPSPHILYLTLFCFSATYLSPSKVRYVIYVSFTCLLFTGLLMPQEQRFPSVLLIRPQCPAHSRSSINICVSNE